METAVGRICQVTCGVVGVILGGNHRITAQTPGNSLRNTIQTIISIAECGILVKYYFLAYSRQIVIGVLKACNYSAACRFFNGRSHSLLVVVDGGGHTTVGVRNAGEQIDRVGVVDLLKFVSQIP